MGKNRLRIGRRKPKRELNPMEQYRRKLKEKKHVKDYIRKLSKKSKAPPQVVAKAAESSEEESSYEESFDIAEDIDPRPKMPMMAPITTQLAKKESKQNTIPPQQTSASNQSYFKNLLNPSDEVSEFLDSVSDLL